MKAVVIRGLDAVIPVQAVDGWLDVEPSGPPMVSCLECREMVHFAEAIPDSGHLTSPGPAPLPVRGFMSLLQTDYENVYDVLWLCDGCMADRRLRSAV